MNRGCFITLEGGEGAGKTTNMAFIEQYLSSHGISHILTREPGGTPLGEKIRGLLLGFDEIGAEAELLLVFAARAEHLRKVIIPALNEGKWVISDRFTDASYAYQGGGRGLSVSAINWLENWVQDDLRPDLTLLFDLPVEIGMARAKNRGQTDRFESEKIDFFKRIQAAYLEKASEDSTRIKSIDASRNLDLVKAEVVAYLDALRLAVCHAK